LARQRRRDAPPSRGFNHAWRAECQSRHRPALRRLCGWETLGEVPSEATFSRAFDAFAYDGRPQEIHEALIKTHYDEKLTGHISRDATALMLSDVKIKQVAD